MRSLIVLFLFSSVSVFPQGDVQKSEGKKIQTIKETSIAGNEKKFFVEINVTQTSSYCGGARPSPEMIEQLGTPTPLAEKKLYIKKGEKNTFDSNIFLEISSDTSGKIQLLLPSGKYFIVDESKKGKSSYNALLKRFAKASNNYTEVNKNCLKNWFEQPDFVFEINEADSKGLRINFHKGCIWTETPCVHYTGPKPP